jgi:hypothetical protein
MADYNTLIDNGNFAPANYLTPEVKRYQDFRYGWLLNLNLNQWHGWGGNNLPLPTLFDNPNVPVAQWAIEAKSRGVDYAMYTIYNEEGFLMYESEVTAPNMQPIAMGNGLTSPQRPIPYHVTGSADKNVVPKFMNEFRSRGIEAGFYINIALNYNLWSDKHVINIPNAQRQEEMIQYNCLILQEIVRKFDPAFLWLDAGPTNSAMMQRWYNAIKSINPACVVVCNNAGNMDLAVQYPYDVQSCEEYSVYSGNKSYRSNYRMYNGELVYIGQEICGTPYGINSEWYDWSNVAYPFPHQPLLQRSDLTQYQSIVSLSRQYKRPFLAGVLINRAGVIITYNLDYLDRIDFELPNINENTLTVVQAKVTIPFEATGINADNIAVIYLFHEGSVLSYVPGRFIQGVSQFEVGKSYLIQSKKSIDLRPFVYPPFNAAA